MDLGKAVLIKHDETDLVVLTHEGWPKNLGQELYQLQKANIVCDLSILLADGRKVQSHSCVMMAVSPVLRAILLEYKDMCMISLPDIQWETFSYLLEYVYLGKIQLPRSRVSCLLAAAQQIEIQDLVTVCQFALDSQKEFYESKCSEEGTNSFKPTTLQDIPFFQKFQNTQSALDIQMKQKAGGLSTLNKRGRVEASNLNNDQLQNLSSTANSVGAQRKNFAVQKPAMQTFIDRDRQTGSFTEATREVTSEIGEEVASTSKQVANICDPIVDSGKNILIEKRDLGTRLPLEKCPFVKETIRIGFPETTELRNKVRQVSTESEYVSAAGGSTSAASPFSRLVRVMERYKVRDHMTMSMSQCETESSSGKTDSKPCQLEEIEEKQVPVSILTPASAAERKTSRVVEETDLTLITQGEDTCESETDSAADCNLYPVKVAHESKLSNIYPHRSQSSAQMNDKKSLSFICEICGKGFASRSSLKKHGGTHRTDKPYKCSLCPKAFSERRKLAIHQSVHTGEKLFKCSICNKELSSQPGLIYHKRVHDNVKPYPCQYCGKRFRIKTHLTEHERVHTGEMPYACNYCGRRFSIKRNMENHRYTHLQTKPFTCALCGHGFIHKHLFEAHAYKHMGLKPFTCGVCQKGFTRAAHLKTHQRSHTKERPHHCGGCGKGFLCRQTLKEHEATHTGECKYECETCGKKFMRRSSLYNHRPLHSVNGRPWLCKTCGKSFVRKAHLDRHMQLHLTVKISSKQD